MAIIQDWLPPSRENFEYILFFWQLYPALASMQWLTGWYGMGKTSSASILNIPGRIGWAAMECPGFMMVLYIMWTLPAQHGIDDLPWQNKVLAGLFVLHYCYRAILFPIMQPAMAPIHVVICLAAFQFQLANAVCIGSWLAAYGPTTQSAWREQLGSGGIAQFVLGIAVFYLGLAGNFFHDEELREIRRREDRRREKVAREEGKRVDQTERHYSIPQAGFFKYMLYPHYLLEWCEWLGFYAACGWSCVPARMFLVNELAAMIPRAVRGRRWYIEKFGEEQIKGRWAVIPGLL